MTGPREGGPRDGSDPAAAGPDSPFDEEACGRVLEEVLRHCEPYLPCGLWDRFRDPAAYRLPADEAATAAALVERFPLPLLWQSGVLDSGSESPRLQPKLRRLPPPDGPPRPVGPGLIALSESAGGPPFDFLTESGCLRGDTLPVLAAAAAARPPRISVGPGEAADVDELEEPPLFATADLADAADLRALGYPAAPVTGLECLAREGLSAFAELYGPDGDGPELVLVGGSVGPADPAPPAAFAAARDRLRELGRNLGIEFARVRVWDPGEDFMRRFRFALTEGRLEDAALLLEDVQTSAEPLGPRGGTPPAPTASAAGGAAGAAAAAARLGQVRRAGADRETVLRAVRDDEAAHEQVIVLPLIAAAEAATDPVTAAHLYNMADAARVVHLNLAAAREAMAAWRESHRGRGSSEPPPPIDYALQATDRYAKASAELREWLCVRTRMVRTAPAAISAAADTGPAGAPRLIDTSRAAVSTTAVSTTAEAATASVPPGSPR